MQTRRTGGEAAGTNEKRGGRMNQQAASLAMSLTYDRHPLPAQGRHSVQNS